ncbi:MAG TPA: class I mannose-6-phosphate isomerase [Anaerolineae bacterium]|nr:class I mannose-6-phosphate isomerase [Anaerolineae bacterium]MCB0176664.1 class I mannose-6-phosphate isomerase [Anaerolineae bacterium]MCB9108557.1 class I mannose-6-phosphate isomerase [Anaerolineales bacterium]HRV91596.1 class I mannose-6-phosphate isomerase [Anaerolineae bacterium]
MSDAIYPLTFSPVFRSYIWGGRNLETKLGRTIPNGIVAESWEISGHPSSPTKVAQGLFVGKTLIEVMDILGLDLVGSRSQQMLKRGKFPLLIKLLDANQPLSVQVHPKDDYANIHENGELGKTEMWYILYAKPGAHLIYGLRSGVTPESFRENLEAGTLETCLHELPVVPGDSVFIPAGSIHAIMDGIVLAEIQQNSDTTYRVYDWNRVDAEGKSRPLHVDKAIDVTNFEQVEPGPYLSEMIDKNDRFRHEFITRCPYFNVERLKFSEGTHTFSGECDGSTFEIWGVMSGRAVVIWDDGNLMPLSAVRFVLLPAQLGKFEIEVTGPATLLRTYVPE